MDSRKKKLGIMGGTFNPIHNGHLLLAEIARDELKLDQVLFMPSGNSYMKDSASIVSKKDRIQMTALAISDNPYFKLSLLETERQGATYTCDTLTELRELMPEHDLYFILGADSLFSIDRWKNPEMIMQNCVLTASVREGSLKDIEEKAEDLKERFRARIHLLPERNIDISSTEIRRRLKEGRSVKYMLPDQVLHYIRENNLYQD
ncbi:MAG: nicotinate-nucleotide adenylyltransferase [Lachnospiraceae bacterium]|nr:nicotinate-nucleotide adenylyltransferase [Lachnospiraceae bacterium]